MADVGTRGALTAGVAGCSATCPGVSSPARPPDRSGTPSSARTAPPSRVDMTTRHCSATRRERRDRCVRSSNAPVLSSRLSQVCRVHTRGGRPRPFAGGPRADAPDLRRERSEQGWCDRPSGVRADDGEACTAEREALLQGAGQSLSLSLSLSPPPRPSPPPSSLFASSEGMRPSPPTITGAVQVHALFHRADIDRSGALDFNEFLRLQRRQAERRRSHKLRALLWPRRPPTAARIPSPSDRHPPHCPSRPNVDFHEKPLLQP